MRSPRYSILAPALAMALMAGGLLATDADAQQAADALSGAVVALQPTQTPLQPTQTPLQPTQTPLQPTQTPLQPSPTAVPAEPTAPPSPVAKPTTPPAPTVAPTAVPAKPTAPVQAPAQVPPRQLPRTGDAENWAIGGLALAAVTFLGAGLIARRRQL